MSRSCFSKTGRDRIPPRPPETSSLGVLPQEIHWPANSPDLNVIENLWSIIKWDANYSVIKDADSLFNEAARVWDNVSLEVINNLVGDFEPRLRACVAVQGQCRQARTPWFSPIATIR